MIHSQNGIDTVLLRPQAITDGATVTANLDCKGASYATIRVNLSDEESTDATPATVSVLHSDDTVVSNFATIVADESVDLETGKEVRYEIDLKGKKRYLRLAVTAGTGTGSNLTLGAIGTLTRNSADPASSSALGDDEVVIVTA